MLVIKHSVKINAPSDKIFDWFSHLPENYKAWHPDHVVAKWIKKVESGVGSVFYAEQKLDGKKDSYRFTVTKYVKGSLIEYTPAFPRCLNFIYGGFMVAPIENGSVFTATLTFRFGFLLSKKLKSVIEKHIAEEGENLKKALE